MFLSHVSLVNLLKCEDFLSFAFSCFLKAKWELFYVFTAKWRSLRGLQVGFPHRRAELPWSPGKRFWREIQMVGFSTDKSQTSLVSRKKFWREIQMVGLDIMGMMDMRCISRNLMSLKISRFMADNLSAVCHLLSHLPLVNLLKCEDFLPFAFSCFLKTKWEAFYVFTCGTSQQVNKSRYVIARNEVQNFAPGGPRLGIQRQIKY